MSVPIRRRFAAFTLLEVVIVIVIVGVLAGMMVTSVNPGARSQLQAVASVLGRDIEYARDLAVVNSDNYKITFDLANNKWTLTHSGTNTALDSLPINSFHLASETPTQQVVRLSDLPSIGGAVQLFAVWSLTSPPQPVTEVEFQPTGGTARQQPTLVWLSARAGPSARYIAVRINPVTGLFWIENFQSSVPSPATFSGL